MTESTCPVCRQELRLDDAIWSDPQGAGVMCHMLCVDTLASFVLSMRTGNSYSRTLFESFTEKARLILLREVGIESLL